MMGLLIKEEIKRQAKFERMDKIKSMARDIVIEYADNVEPEDYEGFCKEALAKAAAFYDTCEKINFDELPKIVYKKGE